jgi:hypothetical protein
MPAAAVDARSGTIRSSSTRTTDGQTGAERCRFSLEQKRDAPSSKPT